MKAHARNTTMLAAAADQARHVMDTGMDVYSAASQQTRAVGKSVDKYVRTNPWTAVGIAAGAGVVIGMLLRKR